MRAAERIRTSTGWPLEPPTLPFGLRRLGALGGIRTRTARLLRPVTPAVGLRGRKRTSGAVEGIRTLSWSFTDSRAAFTLRPPCGPPGRGRTSIARLSAGYSAAELQAGKKLEQTAGFEPATTTSLRVTIHRRPARAGKIEGRVFRALPLSYVCEKQVSIRPGSRNRTDGLAVPDRALSLLSYTWVAALEAPREEAGQAVGFEPTTLGV